ncbi:hypothetical protein Hanom_Chr13g01204901 [Helianthus anomalus]
MIMITFAHSQHISLSLYPCRSSEHLPEQTESAEIEEAAGARVRNVRTFAFLSFG